jgi:hypothetical protein
LNGKTQTDYVLQKGNDVAKKGKMVPVLPGLEFKDWQH